jgi:hypothetical protein
MEISNIVKDVEVSPTSKEENTNDKRLQAAIDAVDLTIAFSPVLLPHTITPKRCSKLKGGKFAVYDVGYVYANMGDHYWNAPECIIKEWRARYLLQRDRVLVDLLRDDGRFYTWNGNLIMPSGCPGAFGDLRNTLISDFFTDGVFVPNLIQDYLHQYADGTVEIITKTTEA